jgi:hypothetical protein
MSQVTNDDWDLCTASRRDISRRDISRRDISRRDISRLELKSLGHKSIGSFSHNYWNLKQSVTFTFGTHVVGIIRQWDLCLYMTIWNQ